MTLEQQPYWWNSAHRPIWFRYAYEAETGSSVTNVSGKLRVTIGSAYSENSSQVPAVGDMLILDYGTSEVRATVTVVNSSTSFTTDVDYSATVPDYVRFVRIPEIQLYKGYNTGETYDTQLPLTLVATFTPRNSPDNDLYFDVSGYLQSIFTEIPAITGTGNNYELFNRFRLKFDGDLKGYYHVLNSAIEHTTLNEYYVNTGRYLVDEAYPYLMDCGQNVLTRILSDTVETTMATSNDFTNVSP